MAHSPAPGGALAPVGRAECISRGDPYFRFADPRGAARTPTLTSASAETSPPPRPGPRRALTPAGRARSGSRAGVRTRAAPAAPGPRRRSEASAWLQVLWRALRNCSCLRSAQNHFPISRQERRRRPDLARERGGGAYGRGGVHQSRGGARAPGPWEEPIGGAETGVRSPGTGPEGQVGPMLQWGCEDLKIDRPGD